jgi:predicted heme/steroid binding protein
MRLFWLCSVAILLYLIITPYGNSTEEYAEKTGKSCAYCHLDPSGGAELTKAGKDFLESLTRDTKAKEAKAFKQEGKGIAHFIRFLAGFLHIITAIFWFGTILYVHIILKPAYAAKGLPRSEVRLGLISMLIMGITGTILSVYRIPRISLFYETRFGILLLIKIALFLVMVGAGLFAVFFLGPKLKKTHHISNYGLKDEFTVDNLLYFNGKEDREVYIAYKNKIYDITKSESWKDGVHFGRHKAGTDLTEMLKQAPHGEDKIFDMPLIGKLVPSKKKEPRPHEKLFYCMAYLNLVIVILIILILALWRWW